MGTYTKMPAKGDAAARRVDERRALRNPRVNLVPIWRVLRAVRLPDRRVVAEDVALPLAGATS